ncbi:MAG: hypothetical protein HC827_04980 [Cyanobacteria bacterium RM1_2_2]|nr:hypothetical protein [Cyanobacteria bacterium RM1_2_2]
MLSQIVRPMVRTQIRLLANTQATYSTLVTTISQWLGFLGVQANVTQLNANSNRIQLSLTVGKPDACDDCDWEKILDNLKQSSADPEAAQATSLNPQQERKLQRLLAYMIQVGNPEQGIEWEALMPQLQTLGFQEDILAGIRAALKVPQSLEQLMEGLDPDVAAIVLSKAVGIALLDRQVNSGEDRALSALLEAMKHSNSAS